MFEVKGLTVTIKDGPAVFMTPQEAFNLLMMPSFACGCLIESIIPEYGLSSVSDTENKE